MHSKAAKLRPELSEPELLPQIGEQERKMSGQSVHKSTPKTVLKTGVPSIKQGSIPRMCDVISGKVLRPIILLKSSTTCNNGGSPAWGEMTRLFRGDKERFLLEYHI